MKIECTPEELKELLKKEQSECKSESSCETIGLKINDDATINFGR